MKRASTFKRASRETRRTTNLKENEPLGPPEKKRKINSRDVDGEVLCLLNGEVDAPQAQQNGTEQPLSCQNGGKAEWEEGRMANEDVEALLATKILGKSKFDLKGKNEQMTEHIKKLRACIRQFLQVETAYGLRFEQLQNQIKVDNESREAFELCMKEKMDKLAADLSEAQERCAALEKDLAEAGEEKKALLLTHEKDVIALEALQNDYNKMTTEVDKLNLNLKETDEKVKSLQDINKRLSEYNTSLQVYNSKLQTDASTATQENTKTQQEKLAILETLSAVRSSAASLQSQLDTVKLAAQEENKQKLNLAKEIERLRMDLQHSIDERQKYQGQVQALMEENNRFRDFTGKSASELESVTSKALALEESHTHQAEQIRDLYHQLEAARLKVQGLELTIQMSRENEAQNSEKVAELQLKLAEAEQRLNEGEITRRKLHNTIQELKGNIRVFCRVRPLLSDDEEMDQAQPVVHYPQFGDLVGRGIDLVQAEGAGQKYAFSFDKVFGPEVNQEKVFEEISQLVQSALDGYKVCIFAYGQTGSGKTYTMLGQPEQVEHKGLIPRSLEQIFQSSQVLEGQGWRFKMQASMLEIYNETIRDLLIKSDASRNESMAVIKTHAIKHDSMGHTSVSDLTLVEVTSWKEVSALLRQAAQSRTVGKTAMNEQSSRSHCVFTLRISGVNESTEQQVHGVLNLVDLAGSERLSRSGATGDRLKETQAINKSLSCLGDVILAIANKEQHVPYRNSKLTYLLQPCLGGDSKTLMFVNISPDSKSFQESLCSLRFAAKVNSCEIGVPRRQTSLRGPDTRLSSS